MDGAGNSVSFRFDIPATELPDSDSAESRTPGDAASDAQPGAPWALDLPPPKDEPSHGAHGWGPWALGAIGALGLATPIVRRRRRGPASKRRAASFAARLLAARARVPSTP